MKSSGALTNKQERALNALVCERLFENKKNAEILKTFVQPHSGDLDVVAHAQEFGSADDADCREAYYLVRTKSGLGLFFFTLEAGELFCPFGDLANKDGANDAMEFVRKIKKMIEVSVDERLLKEEIQELLSKKLTPSKFLDEIGKKYKLTDENRKMLEVEKREEKNKLVSRVYSTMSGVHINLFCKNDAPEAKAYLSELKRVCNRPFGEIVFWWFVAPILLNIRSLIGAEYAFLFAADDSDDESLVKYYTQSMGFMSKNDVGVNKPWWDWTCTFLCKDLKTLSSERKRFIRIFNTEQQMFRYEKMEQ